MTNRTKKNETIKKPLDLHKPEDLLEAAEIILQSDNKLLYRAVVLESMAALEVYLKQIIVDKELKKILQPIGLLGWIDKQSEKALENRLQITTELLKEKIEHGKEKWDKLVDLIKEDYQYRNKVIHKGVIVEKEKAEKVYNNVYDFLSFLGLYTEVDSSLKELKNFIENNPSIRVRTDEDAENLIRSFYKQKFDIPNSTSKARKIPYLVISYGKNEVYFDIAVIGDIPGNDDVEETIELNNQILTVHWDSVFKKSDDDKIIRGIMLVLTKNPVPDKYKEIKFYRGGKLALMVIKTH
jgi:hypothetical protein